MTTVRLKAGETVMVVATDPSLEVGGGPIISARGASGRSGLRY